MTTKVDSLFYESEKYTRLGWFTVGIKDKEPPKGCTWTDKRGSVADIVYRQKYFCNNDDVKRLAVLLDSIKLGFALDVDGTAAIDVFRYNIVPRLSVELQHKIGKTTHTRSASGGYHWLFEISRQDFPKGVTQGTYWTSIHNGHAEIKVLGTNQYLIERGDGYEPIRGIESIVILSQQEINELLRTLDRFDKETKAVRKIGSKLVQYWTQPKRHDVALYTAGFLYKNGVPKNLACELMEHIIDIADLADDNLQRTLSRVEDTYAKDLNSEPVGGYTKLLEVVNDDESVISIMQKEFGKLGYHFSGNGDGNGNGKGTKQKEKSEFEKDKNHYEYIQKYSISETVLAEAIIIGQKAFFAVADFTDPNEVKITLNKQIELDDDRKTVLKPLDLISYINKPYRFKSEDEFWGNVAKAKQETTDSLYTKVKANWKKFVDADDFHLSICSADTIFTHKQDRVGTCHYLFFVGDNDSGKSAGLTILEYLAYRNMSSIAITYANIYQFLGSRDEGAGTICEDEADNIDQDADKMRLYKSGYTKGKVVPKTDTSYGRTQYKFNAYCFKAFAA